MTEDPRPRDDLSPDRPRGFAVTAWMWIPALMVIGLVVLLLVWTWG